MRLDQFLEKLAMTPRAWFLEDDQIRMKDSDTHMIHCPISWVAREMGQSDGYGDGAAFGGSLGPAIGLSEQTIERIMAAADYPDSCPPLRRRLERACGLHVQGRRP